MAGIIEDPGYSVPITGTLTALNQTLEFISNGKGLQGVTILGTWSGTILFEATIDNTNWFSVNAVNQANNVSANFTTVNGVFIVVTAGYTKSRVRMNPYTSGTANISDLGDNAISTAYSSQSGTWIVQPGNTQNTIPWLVDDNSNGSVVPGTAALVSGLIGGQFNTVLPALTNTQQSAIQLDSSGRVIIRLLTSSDIVSTVQSGTWTTGRTWTLSSGTDSVSTVQSGTWIVQPGNTANTTAWFVKDNSLGTVAAGTAGTQSSLAGGVFNTSLPTLTTGQQATLQLDSSGRLIISPSSSLLSEDHNYGTVGANTLRTAAQIGNATGAAAFGAGTTSAQTLRVVLPTDQTAIPTNFIDISPSTQQITTLDVNTTSLTGANGQIFYIGTPTTNSSATFSISSVGTVAVEATLLGSGGTMVVEVSMDGGVFWFRPNVYQISTQIYSNSFLSPFAATLNTAGITNIRVRATVSWSGSATILIRESLNQSGTVILDALPPGGNIIGSLFNISGTISLPTGAASAGNQTIEISSLQLIDNPIGTVGAGTAGTNSFLVGGVFNTVLPTLTNGQQVALQLDSSGRVILAPLSGTNTVTVSNLPITIDTNYGTVGSSTLRTASQLGNATGTANFGAGTTGAQTLRVVSNLNDGSANSITSTAINSKQRLDVSLSSEAIDGAASPFSTLQAGGKDNSGNLQAFITTVSGEQFVRDVLNVSSQFRAQSVTTTATEALGAASILVNRKLLHITPTNGTIYWGYANTVTTANGSPLFPNNTLWLSVTDDIHVYIIASSTVDSRIGELS